MLFVFLAMILVIELVFKGIINRNLSTSKNGRIAGVLLTIWIASSFVYFGAEEGVFIHEPNYFELLGVSPTSSNAAIVEQINSASPEVLEKIPRSVEFMQKRYRDHYIKFGEINETLEQNKFDDKMLYYLPYYFIYLMIAMVYWGDEYYKSKRILFISTIIIAIYEMGLYSPSEQSDVIASIVSFLAQMRSIHPDFKDQDGETYLLTFEMIRILHALFLFVFVTIIGLNTTFSDYEKNIKLANDENKKVNKLKEISENQIKIHEFLTKFNENKTKVFDVVKEKALGKDESSIAEHSSDMHD